MRDYDFEKKVNEYSDFDALFCNYGGGVECVIYSRAGREIERTTSDSSEAAFSDAIARVQALGKTCSELAKEMEAAVDSTKALVNLCKSFFPQHTVQEKGSVESQYVKVVLKESLWLTIQEAGGSEVRISLYCGNDMVDWAYSGKKGMRKVAFMLVDRFLKTVLESLD